MKTKASLRPLRPYTERAPSPMFLFAPFRGIPRLIQQDIVGWVEAAGSAFNRSSTWRRPKPNNPLFFSLFPHFMYNLGMQYRRAFQPGGTFFFTVVTYKRIPLLTAPAAISLLRASLRYAMHNYPFHINAAVVLPDHLHTIWSLPPGDSDFSTRWRLVKGHFTRHYSKQPEKNLPLSRQRKGEQSVWQRRFWEHQIRDEHDFQGHLDYIHYNPVKHGLVVSPDSWPYSSLYEYVRDGVYPAGWAGNDAVRDWEAQE